MLRRVVTSRLLSERLRLQFSQARGHGPLHSENFQTKSIFIHIPKVAGKSLVRSLYNKIYVGHFTWDQYYRVDPKRFNLFFKFSFVRNPYDRFASAFYYLQKGGNGKDDLWWAKKNSRHLIDIETFLEYLVQTGQYPWIHFVPQSKFIFDKDDKLKVDFVGRYERLQADYEYVSHRLSVTKKLAFINQTGRNSFEETMTAPAKEMIVELYRRDFSLLRYPT